jgi:mannitol-1-phosphate 5-dehydrogenase
LSLSGNRVYAGFGLGAIQSGLFLYEAFVSGNFNRLVVAEVIPETVLRVRENGGYLTVNIAHPDGIEFARIGPIEVLNPAIEADRRQMIGALAVADEIGTAVPGIRFYTSSGAESLAQILAAGLLAKAEKEGPRAVIYTAENHNQAAEILEDLVISQTPPARREALNHQVRFLNTVIGKMSGVITGRDEIESLGLTPMTPGSERAFLVEAFNRILISRIAFTADSAGTAYQRGLQVFVEKDDLLPFEEAKLFGHNATHALAAYLGALAGVQRVADLPAIPGFLPFLRQAFLEESGAALIHRYGGLDPLFTQNGFAAYTDDLLARMVNPWLADTVDRVGRDVERKLDWDDRLIGAIRLGITEGFLPCRYALGAAAALVYLVPDYLSNTTDPAEPLMILWGSSPRDPDQEKRVLELVRDGMDSIRQWHNQFAGNLEPLLEK